MVPANSASLGGQSGAPVKAKRSARVPRPWRQSANPCGRDPVVCYEPTRSPVLILRPFRSWTISSVRPGHRPALSTPMFPANAGRPGGCLSRGRPPSPPPPQHTHTGVPRFHFWKGSRCASAGGGGGKRMLVRVRDSSDQGPPPPGGRFRVPRLERLLWAKPAAPSADQAGKRGGLVNRASHVPASLRATHSLSVSPSLSNLSFPLLPFSPPPTPPVSPLCTSHHSQR